MISDWTLKHRYFFHNHELMDSFQMDSFQNNIVIKIKKCLIGCVTLRLVRSEDC